MSTEALHGVRIVDFSNWWVGSYSTMLLATMGAEVIKVESMRRLDPARSVGPQTPQQAEPGKYTEELEKNYSFHMVNLNKKAVTLNLSDPRGSDLTKRLIALSDATVNNFAPGVMERLGLGYEAQKKVKPDIVMVSASSHGSTGPESSYVGYANVFNALGGIAHLAGYPDGTPTDLRGSIDLRGGTWASFATILGLVCKQRTGRGQFIDVATCESIAALVGDSLMDFILNARDRNRTGNEDDIMSPHNCYPCKGEDSWISIAVGTEEEWQALCHAMGNPSWTQEDKFGDAYSRWSHREELDRRVGEWTASFTSRDLMALLQGKGVAAFPTLSAAELLCDPHLKESGAFPMVDHPVLGEKTHVAVPWNMSLTPVAPYRHAPKVGEHNDYVFQELLGLSQKEVTSLAEEHVIF